MHFITGSAAKPIMGNGTCMHGPKFIHCSPVGNDVRIWPLHRRYQRPCLAFKATLTVVSFSFSKMDVRLLSVTIRTFIIFESGSNTIFFFVTGRVGGLRSEIQHRSSRFERTRLQLGWRCRGDSTGSLPGQRRDDVSNTYLNIVLILTRFLFLFSRCLVGEIDEEVDKSVDLSTIHAEPIPPIRYGWTRIVPTTQGSLRRMEWNIENILCANPLHIPDLLTAWSVFLLSSYAESGVTTTSWHCRNIISVFARYRRHDLVLVVRRWASVRSIDGFFGTDVRICMHEIWKFLQLFSWIPMP